MAHPWQRAESFGFGVNLNTILERSTTQPNQKSSHIQIQHIKGVWEASYAVAVSERFHCLFSKHLVHPWQLAEGMFGFGVYLNTILERSTTRVQRVRLYSLILC